MNQSLVLKVSCKLENLLLSYKTSNNFGCHLQVFYSTEFVPKLELKTFNNLNVSKISFDAGQNLRFVVVRMVKVSMRE